jgi:hypothetical protein
VVCNPPCRQEKKIHAKGNTHTKLGESH